MSSIMKRPMNLAFVFPIAIGALGFVGCASDTADDANWEVSQESLAAAQVPNAPRFGPGIDNYQSYVGQGSCDPVAKPGVVGFRDLLVSTYSRPDLGITRACSSGGQSEHKEGRALDYPFNAFDAGQNAQAQALLNWLLATDSYGNAHAYVRRLGLMYIIWNKKIWDASRPNSGWQNYSGASPHTDHIHFSFGWPGALKQTTWWTGGTAGGSSLSGDGRAEIATLRDNGDIEAWYNAQGFAAMPWGGSVIVGQGFTDPNRVRFADLDGDGRKEILTIRENGDIEAWHNARGFEAMPWGGSVIVGQGFTDPSRVRFADLSGDGRAEIMAIRDNGDIEAWYNAQGFAAMPWGGSVIVGQGFTDPNRVIFTDLSGDGRSEILTLRDNGDIEAWYNAQGFAAMPWGGSVIVGQGFTDPNRVRFADLSGDGRSEIMAIRDNGDIEAWYNAQGFAAMPWGGSVIVGQGFVDPTRVLFP